MTTAPPQPKVTAVSTWMGARTVRAPDGLAGGSEVDWTVEVFSQDDLLKRRIVCLRAGSDSRTLWTEDDVIWPVWVPGKADDRGKRSSALSGVRDHWTGLADRLRESAKWMSTVLGAALGLLIGTLPFGEGWEKDVGGTSAALGIIGLTLLSGTLMLLLRVIRPADVSFADVQEAPPPRRTHLRDPLGRWRRKIETQQDLYLPCGVANLDELRKAVIIEEVTLAAIDRAVQDATRQRAGHAELRHARVARFERLTELKQAVQEVATIGEFYTLKHRSGYATYLGIPMALLGMICLVSALVVIG